MNQDENKRGRGGPQPGAGRPRGSRTKLSAQDLLDQIKTTCGKPFEELVAEGYRDSILNGETAVRQGYEKMILSKVIADKQEIDHTSLGQAITNVFTFTQSELPDWKKPD